MLPIAFLCLCQECQAISQPKQNHVSPQPSSLKNINNHNQPNSSTNRRSFLSLPSVLLLSSSSLSFFPSNANALKPKNDALCGTGFFEHIYEYKCTSIGDIEDEGKTKEMNSNEVGLTDSLMGKLNLSSSSSSSFSFSVEESEGNSKLNANNNVVGGSTKESVQRKR